MFSFTCSFVNENIFELNKKFNSRTLIPVPEHAGFALLRCQPRGSCRGSSKIPPSRGRGKLLQASRIHLWDLWDHKTPCEGTGNGIPPSVIAIPSHYSGHVLALPRQAMSSLLFPWVNPRLLQGPGMHWASQNPFPMDFLKGESVADALVSTADPMGPSSRSRRIPLGPYSCDIFPALPAHCPPGTIKCIYCALFWMTLLTHCCSFVM